MEKIPISRIKPKPQYPPFITPDVEEFSVFRSNGNNTGLVGFQIEKIFFVFLLRLSMVTYTIISIGSSLLKLNCQILAKQLNDFQNYSNVLKFT